MLLCSDVRLGAINNENLTVEQSHKWQAVLKQKMVDLFDQASLNNCKYIALFGRIFAQERVSEAIIDDLFSIVSENEDIQTLLLVEKSEYDRLNCRKDIPNNLHLLNMSEIGSYSDDNIKILINEGSIKLKLSDNEVIEIKKTNGCYEFGLLGKESVIPSFEPNGFDEEHNNGYGHSFIEWSKTSIESYKIINAQAYAYKSVELKILSEDGQKEILAKIFSILSKVDHNTLLRITITGKLAFGINFSIDAIKKQLENKIFYVEVYDNTVMDINEDEFENDISLRSEFVKLALQDNSLSESERNKVISCGWNVLSGKGGID